MIIISCKLADLFLSYLCVLTCDRNASRRCADTGALLLKDLTAGFMLNYKFTEISLKNITNCLIPRHQDINSRSQTPPSFKSNSSGHLSLSLKISFN